MFSHLSKNSIFLLFIIFLITYAQYAFSDDDVQYQTCKNTEKFQCANKANVTCPFWGSNTPKYRGHPEFELNCTGTVPQITIESITYRILDIKDDTNTLTVARADYWDNLCPEDSKDTALNNKFFEYASATQNLTLYYSCQMAGINIPGFTCPDDETGRSNYYATEAISREASNYLSNLPCEDNTVVRVSESSVENLGSPTADLSAALESGFGIVWKANDSRCDECVKSNGVCGSNNVTNEFVCYCKDGPNSSTCSSASTPANSLAVPEAWSNSKRVWVAIGTASALCGIITLYALIFYYRKSSNRNANEIQVETFIKNYGSSAPRQYSYAKIKKMTNSFAEKIGRGGFGDVYKGRLPNGCPVAIKVLNETKGVGEDFINEVASIGRTSHVNVVSLHGFCYKGNKRALVYEYMSNGSLDKFLFERGNPSESSTRLGSGTLYNIAIGVARGLEYLHRGCKTRILHFDIKPQNILLDEEFCPKISDFGLAKLWLTKESMISMMGARGTIGYIAPELFSGRVSYKSDVYSYGMLVLEMVGGRKNFDSGASHTSEIYFPNWIYKDLEQGGDLRIDGITTEDERNILKKMILVSFWCIQMHPSDRPSMSNVIEMLEGSVESLRIPPKPYLFSPSRSCRELTRDSVLPTSFRIGSSDDDDPEQSAGPT